MSKERTLPQKVNRVLTALALGEQFALLGDEDLISIKTESRNLLKLGWSEQDVIAFMNLTEELNPDIDEDDACKQMAVLTKKNAAESAKRCREAKLDTMISLEDVAAAIAESKDSIKQFAPQFAVTSNGALAEVVSRVARKAIESSDFDPELFASKCGF